MFKFQNETGLTNETAQALNLMASGVALVEEINKFYSSNADIQNYVDEETKNDAIDQFQQLLRCLVGASAERTLVCTLINNGVEETETLI